MKITALPKWRFAKAISAGEKKYIMKLMQHEVKAAAMKMQIKSLHISELSALSIVIMTMMMIYCEVG